MISRLSSPAFQEQFPGKPYSCQRLPPVNKPAPQPLTVQSQATPQKRNACLKWLCVHTFSWCNQPGRVLAQTSVYCHVIVMVFSPVVVVVVVIVFLMVGQHQKKPIVAVCRTILSATLFVSGSTPIQTYPCKKNYKKNFNEKQFHSPWEEIQPSNCLYPGFFLQDSHPQPQICWQMNQLNYLTWEDRKLILKMIGENFILDYLVGCCYQDPSIILTATEINFTIPRILFSSECVRLLVPAFFPVFWI